MDFMSASPDAADLASESSCGMMPDDFRSVVVIGFYSSRPQTSGNWK